MLNHINIDRINYTNISLVEQKRFYNYMYLLNDIHPFKIDYLLNTTNINTHSVIERFIYDIVCTQLSTKLDQQFNHSDNYITFCFKKTENECCEIIDFNCVENSIMTSIINLSDSITTPLLFVKLTNDDYVTNNTQHIRECELSISKPGNILTFDPNAYMYDNVNMFNTNTNTDFELNINDPPNYSLVIQILNKPPINTPLFNYDINSAMISQIFNKSKYELHTNNSENIERISYIIEPKTEEVSTNILLQKENWLTILNQTFELKDKKALNGLSRILEPYVENHLLFKLKVDEQNNKIDDENGNADDKNDNVQTDKVDDENGNADDGNSNADDKTDNVDDKNDNVQLDKVDDENCNVDNENGNSDDNNGNADDTNDNIDDTNDNVDDKPDKFLQRFTHKSILTPIMCEWIIHEAEQYAFKNGWKTDRHNLYPTTDIPVESIHSVFAFMLLFIKTIDELVCKSYNVEIEKINIIDMFIAKYDPNHQNSLNMHTDGMGTNLSISILLNDEFEGGNLIYEDDIISYGEKGDVVMHTYHHGHGVTPVTKGVRYALVMFLKMKYID